MERRVYSAKMRRLAAQAYKRASHAAMPVGAWNRLRCAL